MGVRSHVKAASGYDSAWELNTGFQETPGRYGICVTPGARGIGKELQVRIQSSDTLLISSKDMNCFHLFWLLSSISLAIT